MVQAKHSEMLQYNNELATLQTRLDRAENKSTRLESRWTHAHDAAANRTLLVGRIKMCACSLSAVL